MHDCLLLHTVLLHYLVDGILPLLRCFYTKFYKPKKGGNEVIWSSRILSSLLVCNLVIVSGIPKRFCLHNCLYGYSVLLFKVCDNLKHCSTLLLFTGISQLHVCSECPCCFCFFLVNPSSHWSLPVCLFYFLEHSSEPYIYSGHFTLYYSRLKFVRFNSF